MESIYKRIKELRTGKKMTQTELAQKTGYKDKTAIAKIEAGKINIPQSKIKAFADALEVSVSYLLDGYDADDALAIVASMSKADQNDFMNRLLLYLEAYNKQDTNNKYPITMQVSEGEQKLINELRERKEIDHETLEQMFNTILHYKQDQKSLTFTDQPSEHSYYMISVKEFLKK